jgi:RNA polymerase sigma factor (sigma-70 family)
MSQLSVQINPKQIQAAIPMAKSGNESAQDTVFRGIWTDVDNYVRYRIRNHADADDVVQEVMMAAWESLPRFNGQSKFTTYVGTIARRKVADYYRRQSKNNGWDNDGDDGNHIRIRSEYSDSAGENISNADADRGNGCSLSVEELEEILESPDPLPDEIVEQDELRERLEGALDTLTPRLREVVRLSADEGLNDSEIARRFGVNRSTVGRWLRTAYNHLNGELTNQGFGLF